MAVFKGSHSYPNMECESFTLESEADQLQDIESSNKYPHQEDYVTMTDSDFELAVHSDSESLRDEEKSPSRNTDTENEDELYESLIDEDDISIEMRNVEMSGPHKKQDSMDEDDETKERDGEDESSLFDVNSMVSILNAKKVDKSNVPEQDESVLSLPKEMAGNQVCESTDVVQTKLAACKPCKVILSRVDYYCIKPCNVALDRNEVLAYKLSVQNKTRKNGVRKQKAKSSLNNTSMFGCSKTLRVVLDSEEVTRYMSKNQNRDQNMNYHVSKSPSIEEQVIKKYSQDNNVNNKSKCVRPISQYVSCKICSKLFPTQKDMYLHVKMCHKPLNHCKFCADKFISSELLFIHVFKNHGVKPYCKNCKEIFYSEYHLEQHYVTKCKGFNPMPQLVQEETYC